MERSSTTSRRSIRNTWAGTTRTRFIWTGWSRSNTRRSWWNTWATRIRCWKWRADYAKGEYQWVAEIANALVFADPGNQDARYLCADALEQQGYQAESGAWRNVYLVAAFELRSGTENYPQTGRVGVGATAQGMDAQTMLDYMGIMLDAEKLADRSFTVHLKLEGDDDYLLKLHHGVLLYYRGVSEESADLTLSTVRAGILAIANGNQENIEKLVTLESGDETLFPTLCESMTAPELYFHIIEP